MKTKALILGAKPPFEGPWVPLNENVVWWSYAEANPPVEINGECSLSFVDSHGSIMPVSLGLEFSGKAVRASLEECDNGVSEVSIFIQETES